MQVEGDEDLMREELLVMMGESKLRLWPLVDQLIWLEELEDEQL